MFASGASIASPRTPDLLIGNVDTARDRRQLAALRVTHILDMSGEVEYEPPPGVVRLCLAVPDVEDFDIRQAFARSNAFIWHALDGGGRVLVHCRYGVSRSAAVVLAYLLSYEGMSYADALRDLTHGRPVVCPNRGFARCLAAYQAQLLAGP